MKSLNRENIRQSLMYHTNNKKHICETLRFIYDIVDGLEKGEKKDKIIEFLIDAMEMAKKMQTRLSYYQKKYKDNTGNKAQGIVGLTGVRAKARLRKLRKERDKKLEI